MHSLEQTTLGTTWKSTIEFSSVHSKSLRLLLMVHSGEKSNQCNQCHYVCYDSSALRGHLKTHIREKTSKCNQCQFASHQVGNLRRHLLNGGEKKDEHCYIYCGLRLAEWLFRVEDSKIQTKKWKFQFKHFPVGYLCFPFFGRDFGIFKFFWLIKSINTQRNIREKYLEKIPSEYEYEYYSVWENHPNTNTNNIRFEKLPEDEYE